MPYFKNNDMNILFIHIPKTGGTSFEKYMCNNYNFKLNVNTLHNLDTFNIFGNISINSSLQHMTYQTIMRNKNIFKIDTNNLKIITIVRNPYEKIISDLFFNKMITIDSSANDVYDIIIKYIANKYLDNHNAPQYLFVTDSNKQLIPNITILHTETLTNDMIHLGYANFNYHNHKNQNSNIDYYKYLNDKSIKLINEYYKYDFKLFNYSIIDK